ncbi:MAG: radical SAM protein [bacterium]|nr:radical SAM protein [bacterium]
MKISNGVKIGGIQKTTLIDYPGCVACTVFFCGCNFRCPFCYSSELVLPEKIKLQPKISEKEFFDFLRKRKGLLEGVVICGGEPTINKELPGFIKKIKGLGYLVKLDTNGSNPEMLRKLIGMKSVAKRPSASSLTSLPSRGSSLIDYVAMDIKAPWEKYNKSAGVKVNLNNIKKSVEIIKNSGIDYEFRSTIVPTIHTKEEIIQIAKDISPAKKFFLQSFRPEKTIDTELEAIRPYSKEFFLGIKKEIAPFFEICEIRD